MMDVARENLLKQEPVSTEHQINARLLRPNEKLIVAYPDATLGLEIGMTSESAMQ